MDLYRTFPVDICFLEDVDKETQEEPYPHKMTLLRPELIQMFYEHKWREAAYKHQETVFYF
jgi:protein TIF31